MATLTPFLWFDGDLTGPIELYTSVFPDAVVTDRREAGDDIHGATIEILGQRLHLFNGGPAHAGFTETISMMVEVETQAEIDDLWSKLTDGGEESRCGWCKDRYGLVWQIVPTMLGSVIGGPDPVRAQHAVEAMLTMAKLDIAALQAAYDA